MGNEEVEDVSKAYGIDTEWDPSNSTSKSRISTSSNILSAMKTGDVKKIVHRDMQCDIGSGGEGHCSLSSTVDRLRKKGWKIEYYHEERNVAVYKRNK